MPVIVVAAAAVVVVLAVAAVVVVAVPVADADAAVVVVVVINHCILWTLRHVLPYMLMNIRQRTTHIYYCDNTKEKSHMSLCMRRVTYVIVYEASHICHCV